MTAQQRIPYFEGRRVNGIRNRLAGKTTAITRPVEIGDTVIMLVEATVGGVNHVPDSDALLWREHKLDVEEAWELPEGDLLIAEARRQAKLAMDRATGQTSLDEDLDPRAREIVERARERIADMEERFGPDPDGAR